MIMLTSRLLMISKFSVYLYLFTFVSGAPPNLKETSLREEIRNVSCVFPPANLTYPSKCSEWTRSTTEFDVEDLSKPGAVEFFLCTALVDSTKRLCHLVTKNSDFRERVDLALRDSISTEMFTNSNGRLCTEMHIDPNTTMDQAKSIYYKLKPPHCSAICVGLDEKDRNLREPLCKSIQFAHQQIFAARELQQHLNIKPESGTAAVRTAGHAKQGNYQKELSGSSNKPKAVDDQSFSKTESNIQGSSQTNAPLQKITPASQSQASDRNPVETPEDQERSKILGVKKIEQLPASAAEAESPGKVEVSQPEQPESRTSDLQSGVQDGTPNIQQQQEVHTDDDKVENPVDRKGENPGAEKDDPMEPAENDDQTADLQNLQPDDEEDIGIGNKEAEFQDTVAEKVPVAEMKKAHVHDTKAEKDISEGFGRGPFVEAEDSHFFTYFLSMSALCILGYLVYHNKRKIIAMAVEGKKGRNTGRRRPNSASYHKLDSNLEEAMSSNFASTNSL